MKSKTQATQPHFFTAVDNHDPRALAVLDHLIAEDLTKLRAMIRDAYFVHEGHKKGKKQSLGPHAIAHVTEPLLTFGTTTQKANMAGMLAVLAEGTKAFEQLENHAARCGASDDIIIYEQLQAHA